MGFKISGQEVLHIVLSLVLISACASREDVELVNEPMQAQESSTAGLVAFDMGASGMDATIYVPDRSTRGVDPSLHLDEITAIYTLNVGKGFAMTIREEERSLESFQEDWDRDPVWQYEVVSEDSESIIIRRSLPNGEMAHHHFVMSRPNGMHPILMRSDPMKEFSLAQVERMLGSAKTFEWKAQPLALEQH